VILVAQVPVKVLAETHLAGSKAKLPRKGDRANRHFGVPVLRGKPPHSPRRCRPPFGTAPDQKRGVGVEVIGVELLFGERGCVCNREIAAVV
jgi:hypothetical protein